MCLWYSCGFWVFLGVCLSLSFCRCHSVAVILLLSFCLCLALSLDVSVCLCACGCVFTCVQTTSAAQERRIARGLQDKDDEEEDNATNKPRGDHLQRLQSVATTVRHAAHLERVEKELAAMEQVVSVLHVDACVAVCGCGV